MYSNVCVHPDTRDLLGDRVILVRYPDGDYVHFQTTAGEMMLPEVGKATIGPKNSDVVFTLPQPDNSTANQPLWWQGIEVPVAVRLDVIACFPKIGGRGRSQQDCSHWGP